jgi:pimeloyl-ACP methyl ester carboxylesterase
MKFVRHNRVDLALHEIRTAEGPTLLVLHGLGEASPRSVPAWLEPWSGCVVALDFTGHGDSTLPIGGGYSAELLMADADAALRELGPATVLGRGLGAYVALLIAGARADGVRGAILCDGPGLAGGAVRPTSSNVVTPVLETAGPPDPLALLELSRDLRPPDYAAAFVRLALEHSELEYPIAVAARVRPPWLEAVANEAGVLTCTVREALAMYSAPLQA